MHHSQYLVLVTAQEALRFSEIQQLIHELYRNLSKFENNLINLHNIINNEV